MKALWANVYYKNKKYYLGVEYRENDTVSWQRLEVELSLRCVGYLAMRAVEALHYGQPEKKSNDDVT
jgi:hypothetical protein